MQDFAQSYSMLLSKIC